MPSGILEQGDRDASMGSNVVDGSRDLLRLQVGPFTFRAIGYWFAWPGLDAVAFFGDAWSKEAEYIPPKIIPRELDFAIGETALGLAILFVLCPYLPPENTYLVGWAGMIGIVMTLHFGLFHIMSCIWRIFGVEAEPLMNWPILSNSLSDFWGKRWNTAFRNLTHRFIFRPVLRRLGSRNTMLAIFCVFFFSGLVHDLVISVPAGGGYGGPTLFFMIQAVGLWNERRLPKTWFRRACAIFLLVAPAPLLFHPPFVNRVVVPFMQAIGAI